MKLELKAKASEKRCPACFDDIIDDKAAVTCNKLSAKVHIQCAKEFNLPVRLQGYGKGTIKGIEYKDGELKIFYKVVGYGLISVSFYYSYYGWSTKLTSLKKMIEEDSLDSEISLRKAGPFISSEMSVIRPGHISIRVEGLDFTPAWLEEILNAPEPEPEPGPEPEPARITPAVEPTIEPEFFKKGPGEWREIKIESLPEPLMLTFIALIITMLYGIHLIASGG